MVVQPLSPSVRMYTVHCAIVGENKTYSGPPLTRLKITVGQGAYDGTSDWVQVKFRNRDWETCKTDYLNYKDYEFSFTKLGYTVTMDANTDNKAAVALVSCRLSVFRPDDELWVQIIVTRQGWNSHWDGYAFSRIEATFGETVWSYHTWNPVFCDGCNLGYSSWLKLNKLEQSIM